MDIDDDLPAESETIGSDELLSDDNLRLPEDASPLVRLHAIRAWLARRQKETTLEIGTAALIIQALDQNDLPETRLRRRELLERQERAQHAQQQILAAQERLSAYQEAEEVLEDCVNHITVGERLLVEYYLVLDEMVQNAFQENVPVQTPRVQALVDVQHRIEHVGTSTEDE